jgi:hypothetical protein
MGITSRPVSEARRNRGKGNSHLGGIGKGKKLGGSGRHVYIDGEWIDEADLVAPESKAPYINMNNHYNHYNRAMGKMIRNKAHYEEEMKKGGYCRKEKADMAVAEKAKGTPYKVSQDARDIMKSFKAGKDGKGKLSDGAVDKLHDMGMTLDKAKADKIMKEAGANASTKGNKI